MKKTLLALTLVQAILLSACGGGGGGSATTPTNPNPVDPVIPTVPTVPTPVSDLQTVVPAPTYVAESPEFVIFNAYNDFRKSLGLGLLVQDTRLDLTAQNGLKYQALNPDVDFFAIDPKSGRPWFHIQDPLRPGFTGVNELDRAKFAKYPGTYVGENGSSAYQSPLGSFNDLIATVYHRYGLMWQFPRDVGIAVANNTDRTVIMEFGYQSKVQFNDKNYFSVYPADKQENVGVSTRAELPSPYPGLALNDFATKTSYPINVVAETNSTIVVTSFTVTEKDSLTPISSTILTKDNDPNKYLDKNVAFLLSNAPFKFNTTYNVSFTGTVNGVNTVKNWSFKTKAQ